MVIALAAQALKGRLASNTRTERTYRLSANCILPPRSERWLGSRAERDPSKMVIALAAQASKGVASIDQTHLANPPPIGELF